MWLWKNKASFIFIVLFGCMSTWASAQRVIDEESNPPLKDRLYYGGNFGASFGTITFVDVSPLVGAMINNRLSGGVGATYQYFNDRRFFGGSNTLYGGGSLAGIMYSPISLPMWNMKALIMIGLI